MRTPHNDGQHIDEVIAQTTCKKHGAEVGTPCWGLWVSSRGAMFPAVCGARAVRAGFNGKISLSSFTTARNKSRQKTK